MPREKTVIPVAFDMLFISDVCVGSENKICFCNIDLWTALNDSPLLLFRPHFLQSVYWECIWNLSGENQM